MGDYSDKKYWSVKDGSGIEPNVRMLFGDYDKKHADSNGIGTYEFLFSKDSLDDVERKISKISKMFPDLKITASELYVPDYDDAFVITVSESKSVLESILAGKPVRQAVLEGADTEPQTLKQIIAEIVATKKVFTVAAQKKYGKFINDKTKVGDAFQLDTKDGKYLYKKIADDLWHDSNIDEEYDSADLAKMIFGMCILGKWKFLNESKRFIKEDVYEKGDKNKIGGEIRDVITYGNIAVVYETYYHSGMKKHILIYAGSQRLANSGIVDNDDQVKCCWEEMKSFVNDIKADSPKGEAGYYHYLNNFDAVKKGLCKILNKYSGKLADHEYDPVSGECIEGRNLRNGTKRLIKEDDQEYWDYVHNIYTRYGDESDEVLKAAEFFDVSPSVFKYDYYSFHDEYEDD